MGMMEEASGKRTRRANVQRIVLATIAAAGVLGVAAVAPNVIGAMGKLGLVPGRRQGESIKRAQRRLIEKGLLAWTRDGLVVTDTGRRTLALTEIGMLPIRIPRRWDKKWRMLIFDIPERKRAVRERMRRMLRDTGFFCIQRSTWIYPYDCEDAIALLKQDLRVGHDLLYVIVESLENDLPYRKHFKLPIH